MAKKEYGVAENTPGYLPESDITVFTNKKDARAYMRSLASELRELGYHRAYDSEDYIFMEKDAKDLGRAIVIIELWEHDSGSQ